MTVLCRAEAPHSSDPLGFLVCYLISNCVIGAGIPPTDEDKSLVQFFDVMIGDKKDVELDDHLLIVESRSYTAEVLLDCYGRCRGKGLARELLSFMVDLLKRQQSLAALTDSEAMAEASEKLLACLPPKYFEWSHKDMFIALLEITPPSLHSRLMSLAASIGCCVPFIYRRIQPNGNVAMRLLLDGCRKVLGAKSNPLVLSCGTTSTVNRGKTDLIGELFGLGASSQSRARGLSLNSSSPCHNLSVDLLFNASLASGASSVVLADAHGFSSESFGFTTVLGVLMSVAAATVIHVSKNDFTELGEANDDMKNYCDCFIKNNDRFGKATGSCLILVWRDYEDKDEKRFEAVTVWLESKKQDNVSLKLAKIANLSSLNQIRRQNSLKKLNNFLFETMTSHYKNILPTLCQTEEMVRRLDAVEKRNPLFRGSQKDTCLPLYTDHRKTLIKLESDVRRSLDANAPAVRRSGHGKLSDSLFPVLTLKAEHAQLEEKLLYLAATGDVNNEEVSVQLSDLEKLMKDKEEHMASKGTSSFVKDFASLVLKGDLEAIAVVQQTLEKWKMSECSQLLNEQRRLRGRLDKRSVELRLAGEEENSDDDVKAIRDELAEIKETIDAFNVSIDDVWAELICLAGIEQGRHRTVQRLEQECHLSRERLAQTYRDWIMQGNPMQLLRGSPLYMASEFISSVLHLFQEDSDRRVFVISVIGMQSSAKSTLLNYLFGCEFETRAGRCTRGLYASYKRTNELDLLILDSEGLMGIEGAGRDFDNKMTLMVMACSHAVIINHKGDLARQLQELLEVAVFAMNRMEVIKVRPDVLFVLRDQLDRGSSGAASLQGQLIEMQTNIGKMAKKLKLDVNRYLNLHAGSLTLLPVAFASEQRNGKDVILPSSLFSNECAVLRKNILDLYGKKLKQLSVKEFSSLPQWSVHARSVWTTIRQFGVNLLYFENMQQIEERAEAESVFARVVATHIEAPRGYIDECGKQLQAYFKKAVAITSDLKAASATFVTDLKGREKLFEEKFEELKAASDVFTTELEARKKIIEEKAQSSLFSALKGKQHVCDQYLHRLTSRINEITHRYKQAWKRREMEVKEEEIEALLVQRIDRAQSMNGGMSRREFDAEFSQAWQHVDEMKEDSCGNSRNDICREVLSAISDHRLKNINEFVYKFLMPIHELPLLPLATSQTADCFEGFLCNKTARSGNPLERGDEDHRKRKAAAWLKEKVCAFFNECRAEEREDFRLELVRGFLEKEIARTSDFIQRLDEQLEENFGMTTEMPQFVNIMFNCLVFETVSMFSQSQTEEIKVDGRRKMMRQRGLTLLSRYREDMHTAKEMIRDVLGGLIDFCKTIVINIVTNVESDIRKILPNWSAAVSAAFKESFIEGNWRSVLTFCENALAFIRDRVDKTFRFLEEEARIQVLSVAQKNITNEVAFLTDTILDWGQANKDQSLETSHLIEFGSQRRRSSEETVDILGYVPSHLRVRDPGRFSVLFQSHIDERILRAPITHTFDDLFEKELSAVKEKFWEDLEGCSEQCPLCSAPCDHQDKAHLQHGIKHSCQIHFLPAFHGSRNPTTKEPIFLFCSTVKEQNMPVETSDAGPTRAARFLNTRNWDIIPAYTSHLLTLRRAWIKCRKPILQMKHVVDSTPKEWSRVFGGGNDELKAGDSK